MLKRYAKRLVLLPEIRVVFDGVRADAFVNRKQVFFDFNVEGDAHTLQDNFLQELRRLKQTYLKYCLVKPKLVIKFGGASGDKTMLKESLEKAIRHFDHLLAVFVDGGKKMIL